MSKIPFFLFRSRRIFERALDHRIVIQEIPGGSAATALDYMDEAVPWRRKALEHEFR